MLGGMTEPDPDTDALRGAWMLYRLFFGPLAWPVALANVAGLAWCYWRVLA